MKEVNAYEVKSDYFTIYSIDEKDIINNIDKYSFNSIILDMSVKIEEGLLIFNDEERPISIGYDYVYKNYLSISSLYYKNNKKKINELLLDICANIKTVYLYIDKVFVDDLLKEELINNNNIKTLVIGEEKVR